MSRVRHLLAASVLLLAIPPALGQAQGAVLSAVDFRQRVAEPLADQAQWRGIDGHRQRLSAFQAGRPMLLVMSWFDCDGLCPVLLQNLAKALGKVNLPAGDYAVAAVSIDPGEGPTLAQQTRRHLQLREGQSLANWAFFTGQQSAIEQLSNSVGFDYVYDAKRDRYAHPAGVVVISAGGRINRYLLGLQPSPRDLRLALVAAGRGELGSKVQQMVLRCYHFDPHTGRYNLAVMRLLQVVGLVFVVALVLWLVYLQRRRPK